MDDKTEEASQHKLSEARKKGQVAKSADLAGAIIMIVAFMYFSSSGSKAFMQLINMTKKTIAMLGGEPLTIHGANGLVAEIVKMQAVILIPFFGIVLLASVAGHMVQSGWLYSTEPLQPKAERLNPVEGFKRVFNQKAIIEFVKVVARTTALGLIVYFFIKEKLFLILKSGLLNSKDVINVYGMLILGLLGKITMLTVIIAGLDYILQRFLFLKDMRMNKQEMKDEYKMLEGDPFLKQRMKAKARQLVKARMLDGVKDAKVVVTNPTHFAVALRYIEDKDEAPIVVAKGADHLAAQIKELAKKFKVPLHENKALAQALYKDVKVGQIIPEELFQAVAEVIAYIERLEHGIPQPQPQVQAAQSAVDIPPLSNGDDFNLRDIIPKIDEDDDL